MTQPELGPWLAAHDLEGLLDTFVAQDITVDILGDLSEEDLREMGLSIGMRRRLRRALDPAPARSDAGAERRQAADTPEESQGERRRITVVFIDLVGSTALSARLDPEELRGHLDAFQHAVSAVVARYDGFVARFMGDGLLAYFGYPTAHEDDPERAVLAGLDAVAAVAELTTPAGRAAARVGIASGLVVVGDVISAGETRERSVVGETPNLAARLQAEAGPGEVVVSGRARRLAAAAFSFRSLGFRALKGFAEPVEAFAVEAVRTDRSRFDARAGASLLPLLGRDQEIALLRERWQLARDGEGQAVRLVGEAGIGKSRITHALVEDVRRDGGRCLVYQCSPLHLDSPLWPVLEQIRSAPAFGEVRDPNARRARVESALARFHGVSALDAELVCEALGLSPDPRSGFTALTARQKRARVLHTLLAQVLALAAERPLLVVVEDVHWVDPSTRELVATVLQAMGKVPMMLLMTGRPDGSPALPEHAHVTSLTLNRLSRQATEDIVRHIASRSDLPPELVAGIVSRTDGVPLFAEELTRAMLEAGPVEPAPGAHAGSDTIPETLHDSLMARLDRVPALKGVAQVAACIGRSFEFSLLASVCDLATERLVEALDGLVAAGLVFPGGASPAAHYAFKHALVRDAAYESMLNTQRRAVHGRIADAIETRGGPALPELVAVHAAGAGDTRRAIDAYGAAGKRAAEDFANTEAVSHFRQALALLPSRPPGPERDELELELLQALGVPLIAVRGYASEEVEALFDRARALCDGLAIDDARRFRVLRGLWNCLYDRGENARSHELATELVVLGRRHADPVEEVLAHRALGSTLYVQGDLAGGREALEKVLATRAGWSTPASRLVHGEAPELIALKYTGWIEVMQGRPDSGLARVEQALERSRATGMPIALAFALAITEIIHWQRDDPVACARTCAETRAVSEEHDLPFWAAHSEVFAGWAAARVAPDREALGRTRAGLHAWMATGAILHVPTWSCVLAQVAIEVDALDEAGEVIARALALAERNAERFMVPELLRLDAALARRRGPPGVERERLDEALAIARRHGSFWLALGAATDLARCLDEAGETAPAHTVLEAALQPIEAGTGCRPVAVARDLLAALRSRG